MKILLKGIGASTGVVTGKVVVAMDPEEALKKFRKESNILVVPMTDPNWTILMSKASAIVTDIGGILSHAAIVARELGIPYVVGTRNATTTLKDGMKVKVDGDKGIVYLEG